VAAGKTVTTGKKPAVFLKAIQIQGFKSFADKIKIDFQPGLSVIVGPNGSGKSNTVDAVRWVLGEQSAKSLRGSRMEDVIFAGSTTRRPVGMAEVSLIFDNTSGLFPLAYEEVVITRRVFRDGEGQFLINKTPCRLKDIQELFMDTGTGKEGFSIIGQGRVEEILNLKAEERRLLIEEVAGISKFRLRKKEALKKLEDTEQNISRLEDILTEVQARLEPLARQAQKAQECRELTAQCQKTEITLLVNELREIDDRLKKILNRKDELQKEITALSTKISEEESIHIRAKYEFNQLEEQIQDVQAAVYSLENNVTENHHQITLINERRMFGQEQLQRVEKEIFSAQEKDSIFRDKFKQLSARETQLKQCLDTSAQRLASLEAELLELRSISQDSRLEELKTEIFEEISLKSKLGNELIETEYQKDILSKQETQLGKEAALNEEEKNDLLRQISLQDSELQETERKKTGLLTAIHKNKHDLARSEEQLLKLEEKKMGLLRRIEQAAARKNALQALENNLEGYHKGVRETVLAYRQGEINCEAFYGTVAENIRTEARYELALGTALGQSLQNIIVADSEDAKKCIAYLKKTNKGRATFLPLASLKGSVISPDDKTRNHRGFIGVAVDLVQHERHLRTVMEALLGRILIADNMDSAVELAEINNYRVRVVTLQGDQVNPGGSLTGGSVRNQDSGLLSRNREIADLMHELEQLRLALEKTDRELTAGKIKCRDLEQTTQDLEQQVRSLDENRNILAFDLKQKQEKITRLEESLKIISQERSALLAQDNGLTAKKTQIEALIEETAGRIALLQTERENLEKRLKETNIQVQELTEITTAAKVEAAKWEQEFEQLRQLIAAENENIRANAALLAEKKSEQAGLLSQQEQYNRSQEDFETKLAQTVQELDRKKYQLIALRQEREELAAQNFRMEEALQAKYRQVKDGESQLHQNELRLTRLQTEWDTGLARLREEFSLDWEEALTYQSSEKKELLQEKLADLKTKIEELGPVNYAALEEYPQTLKRFEFLTSQKNDLLQAAGSLYDLINELNQNMTVRFQQGFLEVNQAFKEVFRQLFNGGNAELQLDDPENLLETGVRIIAQPPGKKAQLLSLLSGGERAFTAIALLFAFLKVKPSPFCLLDEIEATLDEANVKRFISYLRTLTDQTQFILISHRRGTMECADKLYGITMEESGVSKLLTVELKDKFEHDIA